MDSVISLVASDRLPTHTTLGHSPRTSFALSAYEDNGKFAGKSVMRPEDAFAKLEEVSPSPPWIFISLNSGCLYP